MGIRTVKALCVAVPMTYVLLILTVAWFLAQPEASPSDFPVGPGQAVFTATSAVCLAGLTVRDTANHFSAWGQGVLTAAMGAGALAATFFGGLLAVVLAERLSGSRVEATSRSPLGAAGIGLWSLLLIVVASAMGTVALLPMWADVGMPQRWGLSIFHSVSALSNAGFSTLPGNLENYRYSLWTFLVIGPLIVLGGLGLPVVYNLVWVGWTKVRRCHVGAAEPTDGIFDRGRLTTHTKLVLIMTALLYVGGTVVMAAGQFKPYLNHWLQQGQEANPKTLPALTVNRVGGTLADVSFACVTARTAGLHTQPVERLEPLAQTAMVVLMGIGAAPAGTGGGLKVTVVAVLVLTAWGAVRGRGTKVFGRPIPEHLVRLALTLAVFYLGLVTATTLLLTLSEPFPFLSLLFESTSAASSCGLSMGTTASLTAFGKVVIGVAMFLGRVGPVTLLAVMLISPLAASPGGEPTACVALV